MKYVFLSFTILLFSCNSETPITEDEQKEFAKMCQTYQLDIMEGADKLDAILAKMDKNLQMWENDKVWTYALVEKFGPHLPKKKVIGVYDEQILLDRNLGYDFTTLVYISPISQDTMRETSSRIWRRNEDGWKVTNMSNLIKREINPEN
ncbi:MAG: hypothetical protein OEY56_13620 [Cyclobacteriaceae bacterium]|nr:hypothetical protein [Cyclobacteriaceae bacterium]